MQRQVAQQDLSRKMDTGVATPGNERDLGPLLQIVETTRERVTPAWCGWHPEFSVVASLGKLAAPDLAPCISLWQLDDKNSMSPPHAGGPHPVSNSCTQFSIIRVFN